MMVKKIFIFLIILVVASVRVMAAADSTSTRNPSLLVADVRSGYILMQENASTPLPPASLTKVMTLYLTFAALERGWLDMDTMLPVSAHAASQERSKIYVKEGTAISVRDSILALIVKSANDVAVVLAEAMAPTESDFADIMTETARQLNMRNTTFKNASGLHHPDQVTTAQDMAILTLAVINHFPQYYPLFSTPTFEYRGDVYTSHNPILKEYDGGEGLKTGYISAVGYNIVSTAKRDNVRLLGIVIGHETADKRNAAIKGLLDRGFQRVNVQKQAVASGRLSPAMDPMHRQAMLTRANIDIFRHAMYPHIQRTKALGRAYAQQMTVPKPKQPPKQQSQARPSVSSSEKSWGIQVGAFKALDIAHQAAERALRILDEDMCQVTVPQRGEFFRARIVGFSDKASAMNACEQLKQRQVACFCVPPS